MKSLLLLSALTFSTIPAFALYPSKPKAAEEKCEWRKIRRHQPRRCVTESGIVCPAAMCNQKPSPKQKSVTR